MRTSTCGWRKARRCSASRSTTSTKRGNRCRRERAQRANHREQCPKATESPRSAPAPGAGGDSRMRTRLAQRFGLDKVGAAGLFPILVLLGLNAVDELDQAAFNVLSPEIRDA